MRFIWMPRSYREADRMLGKRPRKCIGNNTILWRDGDLLVVTHFQTNIVTFFPDGEVEFQCYNSRTTRERLKSVGIASIYQKNYILYVDYNGVRIKNPDIVRFDEAFGDLEAVP